MLSPILDFTPTLPEDVLQNALFGLTERSIALSLGDREFRLGYEDSTA